MCFSSWTVKKPLSFRRSRSTWLPNHNHDCSLSRPTHTWTCHGFLWKRSARRWKKKKNLGHSLLSLSASRVSCSGASRRGLLCADRIMKCSTSRPPARPIGGERSLKRALGMERPSTNQRSVLALVYTQRHMASLRCPCESGWGR